MINYEQIGKTVRVSVTSGDTSWQDPSMPSQATNRLGAMWFGRFILESDQAIHWQVNDIADPDTAPRLPPDLPIAIMMQQGDVLHVTLADGSTNCSLWITKRT
jgi:hypothetical protein